MLSRIPLSLRMASWLTKRASNLNPLTTTFSFWLNLVKPALRICSLPKAR